MSITRRQFIENSALSGLGLAVTSMAVSQDAIAIGRSKPQVERVAVGGASFYRPYRCKSIRDPQASTWVQIDLGSSRLIDAVELYPLPKPYFQADDGFPLRFRIQCSDEADFSGAETIADWTRRDYPYRENEVVRFDARKVAGRYVRLTATRLAARKPPAFLAWLPPASQKEYLERIEGRYFFALSKIEVFSKDIDIALHRPVSVDPVYGQPDDASQLTRSPRPQGEGVVTDNPQNVTSADGWDPVGYRAQVPSSAVQVLGGLFATALENNLHYLLDSFSVDHLLHQFRARAGKPLPALTRKLDPLWEEEFPGSNAGRFLMGAGKTLHWIDHPELRARLNAIIAGIAECREPNGYLMAYPQETFFASERGAYTRSWVTHGLIEAGYAGNRQAFELLRGYYDWYNQFPHLPRALRECNQGGQGMVANTRMYFTPVGKAEDMQVIQRYFQENYWLADLAARQVDAVWQYPYDRPHNYLLTNLEAYLDLYRATGERRYLNAVLGGWDLFRDNWQQIGGSILMQEHEVCAPKANPLYEKNRGETCGSAFWILLNQRLHLLQPEAEKYVAEIEKSIYNVILANQSGGEGIRYFTRLVGQKDKPTRTNTCCEGQGTRIIASLPEYIYSLAEDGIYVNLFERSSISWQQSGETLRLEMQTTFPLSPDVRLKIQASRPTHAKIRIRIPSWASGVMDIHVNGERLATGTAGSYLTLDRDWSQGDTVSFVLPIALRLTRYMGVDRIEGRERFALEYGPILMAALDAAESEIEFDGTASPTELIQLLRAQPDKPLHFRAPATATLWVPYFEIGTDSFSCVPFIESIAKML